MLSCQYNGGEVLQTYLKFVNLLYRTAELSMYIFCCCVLISGNLHDVMISFSATLFFYFCTLLIPGSPGADGIAHVIQKHSRSPAEKTVLENDIKKHNDNHISCSLHGQLGLGYYMTISIGQAGQMVIMCHYVSYNVTFIARHICIVFINS
jgi:hypothetical protein